MIAGNSSYATCARRAARRAWRRRQGLAHGGTRPLGGSREGEAAKDRIFDGAFSQDADSDDL